jgi:predicted nuclease with TOPRIM domain
MRALEEAVERLEVADRNGDAANKEAMDLLRGEFHHFREEFTEARKERDAELRQISERQDHVSTRIHERMDELSKGLSRIEGYLQARAENR